jgi:hypothetical protein
MCVQHVPSEVSVFITAVPITKPFAWVGGETMEDMCYEGLRAEVVFITAVPITKLFAGGGGGGGTMEDMCYEGLRAEACVDLFAHHALCLLQCV